MPLHFQGQNVLWTLNSFLSADLCSFKPFTLWTFKSRTSVGVWRDAHLPSSKVTNLFNSWAAVASTYPPAFSQDKDGKWERVHWEGKGVYPDWLEEWGDWVEGETECFAFLMATWLLLLHWKCRNTKMHTLLPSGWQHAGHAASIQAIFIYGENSIMMESGWMQTHDTWHFA